MTVLAIGYAVHCQTIKISKNVLLTQLSDEHFSAHKMQFLFK